MRVNGPFPWGNHWGLRIFRRNLLHLLEANEHVMADRGYRNPKCVHFSELHRETNAVVYRVRAF